MKSRSFISKGAANFPVDYRGQPKDIYFLLLPRMTMLAFSSAVEPLRIANQVSNKELYRWFLLAEEAGPVRCSNGIKIMPDAEISNLPNSSLVFVCSGTEPLEGPNPKVLNWINRQHRFGSRFGGICTGAYVLAKTGLLKDRKFTLHWENQPAFSECFPELEPTSNLFEIDRGLMTCGGGNAAIDMMLAMIEADYNKGLAAVVSEMCIHRRPNDRKTPQRSPYSIALKKRNQHLIHAIQIMENTIEDPIGISEIADQVDISRRQLERLFQINIGESPVQFYIDLRVSRAYALLNETSLSIPEIAVATGFNSVSQFSVRFKKKFKRTPSLFRKSWLE